MNHVSKRMGARLRKAKQEASVPMKTKSGKTYKKSLLGGKGTLTDEVINSLQSYFGKAIRDNVDGDVQSLWKAVYASYFHLTSTDRAPAHTYCPKGEKSWCFYNGGEVMVFL